MKLREQIHAQVNLLVHSAETEKPIGNGMNNSSGILQSVRGMDSTQSAKRPGCRIYLDSRGGRQTSKPTYSECRLRAILFLYQQVLKIEPKDIDAIRSKKRAALQRYSANRNTKNF